MPFGRLKRLFDLLNLFKECTSTVKTSAVWGLLPSRIPGAALGEVQEPRPA